MSKLSHQDHARLLDAKMMLKYKNHPLVSIHERPIDENPESECPSDEDLDLGWAEDDEVFEGC